MSDINPFTGKPRWLQGAMEIVMTEQLKKERDVKILSYMYGETKDTRPEPYKLPFIQEVCDLLDVMVLTDIESINNEDENETRVRPVLALGCRAELDAGMVGFVTTPWFRSAEKLGAFCQKHIVRFRTAAQAYALEMDETIPDATDWVI